MFIATADGHVPVVNAGDNPWMVTINVNTVPVEFKVDTGADVSVIYTRADFPGAKRSGLATHPQVAYRTQPAPTSCAWPIHKSPETWKQESGGDLCRVWAQDGPNRTPCH